MRLTPQTLRLRVQGRLREQRQVVRSLLRLRAQLQGSLFARYGACGKAGCACHAGRRHGPYYVLSTRSGGQGGFAYLDPACVPGARALVGRHREFRDGLRRLRQVNVALVTLLRRYQAATAVEGLRRIRIRAVARSGKA